VFYLLAAAAVQVCAVLVAKTQGSIGQAAQSGDEKTVTGFLLTMTVLTLVQTVLSGGAALFAKRFSGRALYKARDMFVSHFARVSYADFSKKNSGEVLSLYANDLPAAAAFVTDNILSQVFQGAALVVSAVFMLIMNPWLTLIYFALFPLLVFMQAKISKPIGKKSMAQSLARAEFNSVVNDALQNPQTVVAYSLEDELERRYMRSYEKYFKALMDFVKTFTVMIFTGLLATVIPQFMVPAVSAALTITGKMTLAEFIAFNSICGPVNGWLTMFSQDLTQLRVKSANAKRILDNTAEPPENTAGAARSDVPASPDAPAVSFNNVTFGYKDGENTVDGITFALPKGAKAAIIGPSGSGKSTVTKLLLSLYEPKSGEIELFGANASDLGKERVRRLISYVPQDSFLFPESIKDNIVGDMPYDEARLTNACREAEILAFIDSLPQKFDSVLTESGENVSGGQKQRIAMARAFYRDADIVVLDESTSALDPATEKAVLDTFYRSVDENGKTAVVVAHREAAIAPCDIVIRLESGKITEISRKAERGERA